MQSSPDWFARSDIQPEAAALYKRCMSEGGPFKNAFGQQVGPPLPDWSPRSLPPRAPLEGRHCRIEPLNPARHAEELFEAFARSDPTNWTYLPDYMGPYASPSTWREWLDSAFASEDPLWYAIMDKQTARAVGLAAYLRMDPRSGVIEVGGLNYSKALQRKPAARSHVSDDATRLRRAWLSPL